MSGGSGQSGAGQAGDGAGGAGVAGQGGAGAAGASGAAGVLVELLAAGPYHTCAVDGGRLSCWGRNDHGELGTEDTVSHSTPTRVSGSDWAEVVVGDSHTCARRSGGSVWCWGDAAYGQLGTGATTPTSTPSFVSLPAAVSVLGSTYNHTCAVDVTGALYAWGENTEGQLAQGDPFPGPGVNRPTPVRVGVESDWVMADGGQGHSCGLRAPGSLWCWGRNSNGELGVGKAVTGQIREPLRVGEASDWTEVRIGQAGGCGLRAPGSLWCWGANDSGQLGIPGLGESDVPVQVGALDDWRVITVDTFHVCGIRQDRSLWCWGRNFEGQLGMGNSGEGTDRTAPTMVGSDHDWVTVSAGRFHTCALKLDGAVLCTGQNSEGQLGLGDTTMRTSFAAVTFPP